MADNNQDIKQPRSSKENLFRFIQLILASGGLFAALLYFLGRLHIEFYYYALGITPSVLKFDTFDYMFSSFNLVIMCLIITFWFYAYWKWSKSAIRISKPNIIFLVIFGILCLVYFYFSPRIIGLHKIGISGMITGFYFGGFLYLFAMGLHRSVKKQPKKSSKQQINLVTIILVLLIIFFFALLPKITEGLAVTQAINDRFIFPKVLVVCKDELPIQLQDLSSNSTNSITGKLVITNNGITYLTDNSSGKWRGYAIPMDSIKNIIYLSEK